MYKYTCMKNMYTYIYIYIHTCVNTYTGVCTCICIYMYTYIHTIQVPLRPTEHFPCKAAYTMFAKPVAWLKRALVTAGHTQTIVLKLFAEATELKIGDRLAIPKTVL